MAQPTTTWPLYFVAESTGGTIKELVRKALAYERSHWVIDWYHQGGEALWRTANKAYDIARGMGREIFSLSDAPHADSPGFSVDLLREALEAQHIRTELPLLSSQIDNAAALPRGELLDGLKNLPAVQALVYLLGAVDQSPVNPPNLSEYDSNMSDCWTAT